MKMDWRDFIVNLFSSLRPKMFPKFNTQEEDFFLGGGVNIVGIVKANILSSFMICCDTNTRSHAHF